MSSEITDFVRRLLETSPGEANSVQLVVDTDGDTCALFEVLLLCMTEMLKQWYPPPITISHISANNLLRMIHYFASFGYEFRFVSVQNPRLLRINNRDYLQKSRLEDMKFQVSDGGMLYSVSFCKLATSA
jgi:hypothetical protein